MENQNPKKKEKRKSLIQWRSQDFRLEGVRSKESKINSKKILIDINKKINKQLYANVIVIYN